LAERVQQHDNLLARLDLLEKENGELKKVLNDKDLVIERLQGQLSGIRPTQAPLASSEVAQPHEPVTATTTSDATPNSFLSAARKGAQRQDPARTAKRRLAAGRLFQTAATKGQQGYQYVYLGRSGKILRSEVRHQLRRAGVDTGRVLDICFPATGVIGVLLHVQYVSDFLDIMRKCEADHIDGFEPLDPATLADSKFADLDPAEREQLIYELTNKRALQTLQFLRPLNVSGVGKYFLSAGWICQEELDSAVSDAIGRLAKKEPKKAQFLFKRTKPNTFEDESIASAASIPVLLNNVNVPVPPVNVSLSFWNANGLRQSTVHDVLSHVGSTQVLLVTETWLTSGSFPSNWTQYHLYGSKVPGAFNRGSGGITAFASPSCPFSVSQLPSYNAHTLSLKVGNLTVHCVYLPPPLSSDQVLSLLRSLPVTSDTIICGDFNARFGSLLGDTNTNPR
ncbi:hypothetical protein FB192DRAFT_1473877, partial [Mucor lusitanicus]